MIIYLQKWYNTWSRGYHPDISCLLPNITSLALILNSFYICYIDLPLSYISSKGVFFHNYSAWVHNWMLQISKHWISFNIKIDFLRSYQLEYFLLTHLIHFQKSSTFCQIQVPSGIGILVRIFQLLK